jgi:hypothetical protein
MPRKAKNLLFGVLDEQAISVLSVIANRRLKFGELTAEASLPKASLFRVLVRLEEGKLVQKTPNGYRLSRAGCEVLRLVERLASRETNATMRTVERRLREMKSEFQREGRVFHDDRFWERTAEKPLAEVTAVRGMTGLESLHFQHRFQEELRHEERALRRGSSVKH